MKPGIAVILPVYNHADFIDAALDSVFSQTRQPNRVIALDDGSTDNTPARLETWKKRGVECLRQPNQGAAKTLNNLVKSASETCGWISILNSDDLYETDRLEICEARARDSGAAVVTTELTVVGEDNQPLPEQSTRNRWFRSRSLIKRAFQPSAPGWLGLCNYAVSTSNIFAHAGHLLKFPFCEKLPLFHDYLFLIQSALMGQVSHQESSTLRYRAHSDNSITVGGARLHAEGGALFKELDAWLPSVLQDDAVRIRYLEFLENLPANISSLRWEFHECARHLPPGQTPPEWHRQRHALVDVLTSQNPSVTGTLAALVESHPLLKETRLRRLMQRSRWLALGTCLGWRSPRSAENLPARDSLHRLQDELRDSRWLALGQKFGSKRCRKIGELLQKSQQRVEAAPLP